MVNGLSYLNYLEFSLIFSLFSLIFRKYFIKILKRFILNKNIITNKEEGNIKDSGENLKLKKSFNTLDKYTEFLTFIIFISFFWIKFINIYFSFNLAENIDSYVNVYNHFKDNSTSAVFWLFSLNNENIVLMKMKMKKNYFKNKNIKKFSLIDFEISLKKITALMLKYIKIFTLKIRDYNLYKPLLFISLIIIIFMTIKFIASEVVVSLLVNALLNEILISKIILYFTSLGWCPNVSISEVVESLSAIVASKAKDKTKKIVNQ